MRRRPTYRSMLKLALGAIGVAAILGAKANLPQLDSFEQLLKTYTFVGDFSQKPELRPNSEEIFWKYQYSIPAPEFAIEAKITDPTKELPITEGDGRVLQHLNQGRIALINGDFEGAKGLLLAARNRFGTTYPFHRRNDYMTAYTFLGLALQKLPQVKNVWSDPALTFDLDNAATFLNWALIVKRDDKDPLIDQVTPKGFYNMAAIYYVKNRFAGAYGAASEGLNFLRRTGRKEYRSLFHQILAEVYIRNRNYLQAMQEIDSGIRLDPDQAVAARLFGRAGDIYFDLNNYELAEDAFSMASRTDRERGFSDPRHAILRGESLFWLGKFSDAQKSIDYGLHAQVTQRGTPPLPVGYASLGQLRIADSYLALRNFGQADLAYAKVEHQFPNTYAAKVAKLRRACLELPDYKGNNVKHARAMLEAVRKLPGELPPAAVELGWACEVASYSTRERTIDMLHRVRQFAESYPRSKFLAQFAEPVADVQRTKIDAFINSGKVYETIAFYERHQKSLFNKVDDHVAVALFEAYVDTFQSEKASAFWEQYARAPDSDEKVTRQALVATEMADATKEVMWKQRNSALAKRLTKWAWTESAQGVLERYFGRFMIAASGEEHLSWLVRFIDFSRYSDVVSLCSTAYPLYARIANLNPPPPNRVKPVHEQIGALLEKYYSELSVKQPDCLSSFLDLENRAAESRTQHFAKMVARLGWKASAPLLREYWSVAEDARRTGEKESANKMYAYIKTNATPDSPLQKFASERLDQKRSELDNLWQQ
jgi:tetratricopeptide (TPR) repeat protein